MPFWNIERNKRIGCALRASESMLLHLCLPPICILLCSCALTLAVSIEMRRLQHQSSGITLYSSCRYRSRKTCPGGKENEQVSHLKECRGRSFKPWTGLHLLQYATSTSTFLDRQTKHGREGLKAASRKVGALPRERHTCALLADMVL